MADIQALVTDNLDIWTAAIKTQSTSGRGSRKKLELTGIKKLRELILELAVRGKLVPQDPDDEPASVLLEKIVAEKEQLIKEKKIKKQKALPDIEESEMTNQLPQGWRWVRLGELFNSIISGGTPSKREPSNWGGKIPWASVKDLGKQRYISETQDYITEKGLEYGSKLAEKSDILICTRMGLGKIAITTIPIAFNQDLKAVKLTSNVNVDFFLNTYSTLKIKGTGTTVAGIRQEELLNYVVGLPPLSEQHRIVAKVDELMALCDQLEQQTEASITAHQTLLDTLLDALANPEQDATAFADSWKLIEQNFDLLFTTEQSIDKLKQTILQLAVMGKLVPQDPNDEPASVLLEKIAAEKEQLIKEKKIKKQKPLSEINDNNMPFNLPRGWEWKNLSDLLALVTDGDHQAPPKSDNGVPFLVIGNLNTGNIIFDNCRHVPEEYYQKLDWGRKPAQNDILYTVTGSYGIPISVDVEKGFCVQRHVAIFKVVNSTPKDYLAVLLKAKYAFEYSTIIATGIAQKTVPLTGLRKMPVSVPPEREQKRIVTKVNELTTLCYELKEQLACKKATQQYLANAFVEKTLILD